MQIIRQSIKFPHAVVVAVFLCFIFGYLSMQTLPLQMKPTVDRPEITINTIYRGASPAEVEEQITNPIEEVMDAVEGIRKITSTSSDAFSSVTLEFDWGVNKDVAIVDVVNKLSQVPDLPDDAQEPEVRAVSSDDEEPIMWFIMRSDKTPNEMYEIAEDQIEPRIRRIEGVGDLFVFGGEEREMQVQVDPVALAGRNISFNELGAALRSENMNVRGGFLDQNKRRYIVRTVGRFESPQDVLSTIVTYDESGGPIYLREIADAAFGYKKSQSVVRHNAELTVVFGVLKKSGANVVETCNLVEAEIEKLNQEFEQKNMDIRLVNVYTDVEYINEAINLVIQNLIIGAVLASIVLLFFLRSSRSVLIVLLSVPTSLITVFIVLNILGRSLNIVSLAGLAFAVGMVVDNAIVVLENIFRHKDMGKGPARAAYDGGREVWGAVLVSTLTTLAVFIPIIFIQEEAGQLFKDIALAISSAIALSLVVSITLIPMASSLIYRLPSMREKFEKSHPAAARVVNFFELAWLGKDVARFYYWVVGHMIGRGGWRIPLKIGIVVGLAAAFFLSLKILPEAEYLPSGNLNFVLVIAEPHVGMNLDKQVESIQPFEQQLMQMRREGRVDQYFVVFSNRFSALGIIVDKAHASEREMQQFVGEIFGRTRNITGFETLFPVQASIFRDPGKQFEVEISGPDLGRLQQTAQRIQGQLMGMQGVVQFVRSSYQEGTPELQVRLDRDKCARVGLRVQDVATAVESLVAGRVVGQYFDSGKDLDLSIIGAEKYVQSKEQLAQLPIVTPTGDIVKLSSIAWVGVRTGPTEIKHLEKERAIILTVNLLPTVSLENAIERVDREVLAPVRMSLPGSYTLGFGGSADKLNSTLEALTGSFLLAVLIVYLLMVALFESFSYPLIIMATVPPAASGAFLGITTSHWLSGGLVGFDVLAMMGLVILAGIVVNNANLIVHQALNYRREGNNPDEALFLSCKSRLRPILMSSMTSVFGMLPLAIGGGSGSELYRGLGAVIVGGLAVSTLFTLFLTPSLMSLVQDIQWYMSGKQWKVQQRQDVLDAEEAPAK
jgi:hydrophobic/amphiphilic exporter-1 (mainly G- bacteria), HAE1 family